MSVNSALRAQLFEEPLPSRLSKYHLSEQQIAGLFATETSHPPGFEVPLHAHNLTSFYLVLEGSLTEICGRSSRYCKTHSVTFTPAGERHRNIFHAVGGRCFLVELSAVWDDRIALSGVKMQGWRSSENDELTWLATRMYHEFRYVDDVSPLLVEGLGLEILGALFRQADHDSGSRSSRPAWLRQAKDFIHDRFSETVSLTEIAAQAGVHPVHLSRSFRKHYGCSIGEYQRHLRLDYAVRQLRSCRCSLAEIAQHAGFSDQAHFSRVFKDYTGLTPARFRNQFYEG